MTDQHPSMVQGAETVRAQHAKESYAIGRDFFYATPPAFSQPRAPLEADSYVSDKGNIQYHYIGLKPQDPAYSTIVNQNTDILLAMGGLVHDYMTKHYPGINSQKLNINTWAYVVSHIPDLSIGQTVTKEYHNAVEGVKVSGEFLSLIASAIITGGSSLLTDFSGYLRSIGDIIWSVHTQGQSYDVTTCTFHNYLIDNGVGGWYDYGAISLRQVKFTENFMELKQCWHTHNMIRINMHYAEIVSLVQTRRLRPGGADYELFQDLIDANSTQQFAAAKNFFNNKNETPQNEVVPTLS